MTIFKSYVRLAEGRCLGNSIRSSVAGSPWNREYLLGIRGTPNARSLLPTQAVTFLPPDSVKNPQEKKTGHGYSNPGLLMDHDRSTNQSSGWRNQRSNPSTNRWTLQQIRDSGWINRHLHIGKIAKCGILNHSPRSPYIWINGNYHSFPVRVVVYHLVLPTTNLPKNHR